MRKEALILIPAYNEATNIGKLLHDLKSSEVMDFCDILVVNDASADETSRIAKAMDIRVVTHVFNLGYGSALQIGYKYAVRGGYSYIIQIDADGQHDICNIPKIYAALRGENLPEGTPVPYIVHCSRFLPGSVTFKVSGMKRFVMMYFTFLIKLFTGNTITDPTSGLQGLNRNAFLYFSMYQNFDSTYPDANLIIQTMRYGLRYYEMPSVMHERTSGESMHSGILRPIGYVFIVSLSVLNVVFRDIKYRKRFKRPAEKLPEKQPEKAAAN